MTQPKFPGPAKLLAINVFLFCCVWVGVSLWCWAMSLVGLRFDSDFWTLALFGIIEAAAIQNAGVEALKRAAQPQPASR